MFTNKPAKDPDHQFRQTQGGVGAWGGGGGGLLKTQLAKD